MIRRLGLVKTIFVAILVVFIIVGCIYLIVNRDNNTSNVSGDVSANTNINNNENNTPSVNENVSTPSQETQELQTPSQTTSNNPQEIDVYFTVDKFENDGFPIFTIHTNLPDNTRIITTLFNSSGYKQNQEGVVLGQSFVTEPFSNNNEALKAGDYKISIEMLNSQYDSVKAIIGDNNEKLVGNCVENVNGKNIAKKTLSLKLYLENADTPINTDNLSDIDEQVQMYLSISSFSYLSLVEQLEADGYNLTDATIAVDKCGANWKEQAVKRGTVYIERNPEMTRQQLLDQLKYEGFTDEEAEYGVEQIFGE